MAPGEARAAVDALQTWSPWVPFNTQTVVNAPQLPSVYMFRRPDTRDVIYVGMAGERIGSGTAQGLRGRLRIYVRGRGAVSGFGESALDHALADPDWVEEQLAHLRSSGPKRAKVWAQEAIAHLAPEVRWTLCTDKTEARAVEQQVEHLLGPHGLWNRASQKARAVNATGSPEPLTGHTPEPGEPEDPGDTVFAVRGHTIDLDVLYRTMHSYSTLLPTGERVFDGHAADTPALKRLLNELFYVPVANNMNPVNNAIRSECRDRLASLGWATKGPGRSAKYTLHRPL